MVKVQVDLSDRIWKRVQEAAKQYNEEYGEQTTPEECLDVILDDVLAGYFGPVDREGNFVN